MPRITRVIILGWPYHVVHRGNNKQSIFSKDEDRFKYLRLVKKYSDTWPSSRHIFWGSKIP